VASAAPGIGAGVSGADDAFGADLYRALDTGGNVVFSPSSIATALQMALVGARGETAAQLAAALRLPGPQDAAPALQAVSDLLAELAGDDVTLRAPNTMWVQAGLPLQADFTQALARVAAVAVRDADFARAAEQARHEINALIAEQTAGKITDLLAPGALDSATRLVLTSAVYLKAAWAHPFPAGATEEGPFHPQPGTQVMVPMMRMRTRLPYLRGDGYQAVELPYAGQRLGMVVILPDGPPGPVEDRLAAGGLRGLLAGSAPQTGLPPQTDLAPPTGSVPQTDSAPPTGLAPRQINLALPRFRVTSTFDLPPALAALGITLARQRGQADFSGITTAERLFIGRAVHQAYIDVDEQGTEAAAATAVVVMTARALVADPPVEVTVDRPFLFAITDTVSGLPLFLGRVTDPTSS
jgi:serpin B